MILERLGKCEEALSVIRGPLGGINTVSTLWKYTLNAFRLFNVCSIRGIVPQIRIILPQAGLNQSKPAMTEPLDELGDINPFIRSLLSCAAFEKM